MERELVPEGASAREHPESAYSRVLELIVAESPAYSEVQFATDSLPIAKYRSLKQSSPAR